MRTQARVNAKGVAEENSEGWRRKGTGLWVWADKDYNDLTLMCLSPAKLAYLHFSKTESVQVIEWQKPKPVFFGNIKNMLDPSELWFKVHLRKGMCH